MSATPALCSNPSRTTNGMGTMQYIENRTYDELEIGDEAELERTLRQEDIELFSVMSGEANPGIVQPEFAEGGAFRDVIAHGMWGGALISAVLGGELPGPGTVFVTQRLSFRHQIGIGDRVRVRVSVVEKRRERRVLLNCLCTNAAGEVVIEGQAEVIAPASKVRRPRAHCRLCICTSPARAIGQLVAAAQTRPPLATAVIHPCDAASVGGAIEAHRAGLIGRCWSGPPRASGRWPGRRATTSPVSSSSTRSTAMPRPSGGGAGADGKGRRADEGRAAHRRSYWAPWSTLRLGSGPSGG